MKNIAEVCLAAGGAKPPKSKMSKITYDSVKYCIIICNLNANKLFLHAKYESST